MEEADRSGAKLTGKMGKKKKKRTTNEFSIRIARFVRVGIRETETELVRQRKGMRETAVVKRDFLSKILYLLGEQARCMRGQ